MTARHLHLERSRPAPADPPVEGTALLGPALLPEPDVDEVRMQGLYPPRSALSHVGS